jgi:hypothetical protein
MAEQVRQFGIGALGDVTVGGQQRLGVGEVELRVRAQRLRELRELAPEPG